MTLAATLAVVLGSIACDVLPVARIGDHDVPATLQCQEDEVIAFVVTDNPPFELGCVNGDALYGGR